MTNGWNNNVKEVERLFECGVRSRMNQNYMKYILRVVQTPKGQSWTTMRKTINSKLRIPTRILCVSRQ